MAVRTESTQKLSQEEINQLNELRQLYSDLTFKRGQLALAEDNLENQKQELKVEQKNIVLKEKEISKELFEKYGKGEINLEDGTITVV